MLVIPSILLVLGSEFKAGLDILGMVVAAGSFMFGLGAIPAGLLERKLGGRRLLLIYQLGSSLAVLAIISAQSLAALLIGVMALGLFGSIYHPAGLTLLSRRVDNLSRALGYHGVAGSLGLSLGPLLAGIFTDLISWRAAFIVLAAVNLVLAFLTTVFIPKSSHTATVEPDAQRTSATNRPALIIYYFIIVVIGFSFAGFTTFMPTHFSLNTTGIFTGLSDTFRGGLFTTIVLLSGIVGQIVGGHVGDRYSRTRILFVIIALNIPLLLLMGFCVEWLLVAVAVLFGAVHFAIQPVGNALIANFTHSNSRGIGYGINFFLNFGVGSIGAALGGVIAEWWGVSQVFTAMGIILLPGLLLAWLMNRIAGNINR